MEVISVLSWNVLADIYIDEKSPEYSNIPSEYLKKEYRYNKILERLNQYNATIILLQEVQEDFYHLLKKLKNYNVLPFVYYPEHFWNEQMYEKYVKNGLTTLINRNGTFWNNTFSMINQYIIPITMNGNLATCVKINDLLIINLHFDYVEQNNSTYMFEQFSYMMNYINTFANISQYKIIIGGDYNFDFKKTYIVFKQFNIIEPFNTFEQINGQFLFKQYNDYNINTIYTDFEKTGKIDNIFVNQQLEQVYQIIDNQYNSLNNIRTLQVYGSDHYPIIAYINGVFN